MCVCTRNICGKCVPFKPPPPFHCPFNKTIKLKTYTVAHIIISNILRAYNELAQRC